MKMLLTFAVLMIPVFIVVYIWNKRRAVRTFTAYYAQKRQEFPWLDKWIKDHVDPSILRAGDTAIGNMGIIAIIVFVFSIIGFLIFDRLSIGLFVFVVIGLVLSEIYARKQAKNPGTVDDQNGGLTLECPSCGCPHSWGLLEEKNIVDRTETTTEEITRKGYGQGDFLDSLDEGFKSNGTTRKSTTIYIGRSIRDFKCLNCGHTEHNEYDGRWGKDPREHQSFSPPKTAWEIPSDISGKVANNAADDLYQKVKTAGSNPTTNTAVKAGEKDATVAKLADTDDVLVLYATAKKASENKDEATAHQLYLKAAELGHAESCKALGITYEMGYEPVEKDLAKAKMWYEKALELGFEYGYETEEVEGFLSDVNAELAKLK
jgi:hypothetical protein